MVKKNRDNARLVVFLTTPHVGAEIMVYTPQEFEVKKDTLFFKEEVLKKGKVIYDAQAS